MVGITYPDGYEEFECENCGTTIQDAAMNAEYDEKGGVYNESQV